MGLLDIIPISFDQIIFYSAIGYTAGALLKQKQIEQFAGYGLMIGVTIWGIKEVEGMLGIDFL
jgi:hypothetical protein